jgi:hypothetical protein
MRVSTLAESLPERLNAMIRRREELPDCVLYDGLAEYGPGLAVLLALLVRLLVGLGSYSGMNDPPAYGDYEAQRNWMALTNARPL